MKWERFFPAAKIKYLCKEIVSGIAEPGIQGDLKRMAFLNTRTKLVKIHYMKKFDNDLFTHKPIRDKWRKYARMARKYESEKEPLLEKEPISASSFFWMSYVTRNLFRKWKQERPTKRIK